MTTAEATVARAVEEAAEHLGAQRIAEARRNAQLLMQHLLRTDAAGLFGRWNERLPPDLRARYGGLVGRRLRREPLQYITRRAEFWSREFYVDPRVPVPRPESEHIVEELLRDFPRGSAAPRTVDVGTGSGCLAVAIALELPQAEVIGIDIERSALEVAAINASRNNVSDRISLLRGDLLEPALELLGPGSVDAVVSNPPYIGDGEAAALPAEVIGAEPRRALVAGPTGLEIFRRLVPQAAALLKPGGRLYLECGARQAGRVEEIVAAEPSLGRLRTAPDLRGIPRVVVGRRA